MKKTIPSMIVLEKQLSNKFSQGERRPENYKTLMNEIETDTNQCKDIPF
jgi:hypothetical protein